MNMNKVKKNILFLFQLLLLAYIARSQTVNKQKLLNLQFNETYVQNFSEFINEPAIKIIVDPSSSYKIIQPYYQLTTYQDSPPLLDILATFNDGPSTKFNIEIQQLTTSQQTIKLLLVYQQLSIDPSCSCVKQTTYTPFEIDEVSSSPQQLYGSFYSYNQGFISYQLEQNFVKSFRFLINGQNSAQIISLAGAQLYQHVAILGPNSSIYIIQYVENTEYQLIKLDSQFNSQIIQRMTEICQSSYQLIDTGRYYFNYCNNQSNTYMKTSSVDFSSEQVAFETFYLTSNEFRKPQIKRVGNNILIGITGNNNFSVYGFTSNDGVINEPFSYSQYLTINQFLPNVNFVSTELMIVYSHINNSIQLFDIKKKVALYQIQVSMSDVVVRFVESLGNQIILYIYDSNNKYSTTIVAEVNIPSLVIQTTSSTTLPIELTIQTVSSTTYLVSIGVQIIQQNTIFFAQNEANLQNTISNIQYQKYSTIPIEDYIIGADLTLEVQLDQQAQGIIQDANLIKQFSMKGSSQMIIDEACTSYQTDGYFSSIFFCPTNIPQQDAYYLYAIYPFYIGNIGQSEASFLAYRSEVGFQYPLDQIDNQGSFTLKITPASSSFYVYVPFIQNTSVEQFQLNNLQVNCLENNFQFASDPAYSVLFTLCGQNITQQLYRPYKTNGIAQIVNTTNISSNSQQITNLICIQGFLFMYNSTIIQAYDYINFGLVGYIKVPTIVEGISQKLTLFKNSFLITVSSDPLTTIAQYSYNSFKTNTPTFIRNLQIDSDTPVSSQGIIIPKRQSSREFAFVLSKSLDTYYMYRINSKQWSNQFYTTLTFNPNQAVLASNLLFVMNPESYTGILPEASILYYVGLNETEFNSNLSHSSQIKISLFQSSKENKSQQHLLKEQQIITYNSGQKQLQENNSLLITTIINRDARAQYGIVNNQANTLNQVRTQIQDTNYVSGQVFNFEDWQTFNACILGWQSDSISQIVQRMAIMNAPQQNQAFPIRFKYNAIIEQNQIKSVFFTIQGQFNLCSVLDDNGSYQVDQQQNYQFQLYVICGNSIKQYQINYYFNQTSGQIINTSVSAPNIYQFNQQISIPYPKRIISANNQLYLYFQGESPILLVTLNNISKQATIKQQQYSYYSQTNIFVLFNYDLQITIYPTGIIQSQVRSTQNISVYDLGSLLQPYNFILPVNKQISSIEQYSDTQFRIGFENDYIYDLSFLLNGNGELVISQAFKYYYQDAFPNYVSGFKGSKYSLFFGYYSETLQKVALYSNFIQQQNIFLIQSTIISSNQDNIQYPQYITEINTNLIQVQYSNGIQEQIKISDNLGIEIFFDKSSVINSVKTSIAPVGGPSDPNNVITFVFQGSSTNESYGIIQLYSITESISPSKKSKRTSHIESIDRETPVILILKLYLDIIEPQIVTSYKYLNLQQNETYIQYLNQFVSEPIIDINLTTFAQAQILQPYQQLQTYYEQLLQLDYLASVDFGDSQKHIISVKQQYVSSPVVQIFFVFQRLSIDSGCSCLKQTLYIQQQLDIVNQRTLYFLEVFTQTLKDQYLLQKLNKKAKSFRFQIKSKGQIEINLISNIQIFTHITITGPQNSIYIIQADAGEYQLIKLKQIFLKRVIELCQIQKILIDPGRYFFKYCRSQGSTIIKVVSIDFTNQNLDRKPTNYWFVCQQGKNNYQIYFKRYKNQYSNTVSSGINIPQIIIQLISPTIQPFELQIKTPSETTYQIQIIPKIVEQNQIFFFQSKIILQKAIQNFQETDQQIMPIEDYIQGSGVDLFATVTTNLNSNSNSNYQVIKYLEIKNSDQIMIDDSCSCYQTEGYFSLVLLCPTNLPKISLVYFLYAAKTQTILQSSQFKGNIKVWKSQTWIQYLFNKIDNQGSFTLKIDKALSEFSFFIPFVYFSNVEYFQLNQIQVSCSELNFQFATDSAYSILFTLCGEKIAQYNFRFQNKKFAQIVKNTNLPIIFEKVSNLICIQGKFFIYNSSQVIAYDYINQGLVGEINVPTLAQGKNQQLALFMSSILIKMNDEPLTIIAQYSFNNFKTKNPTFMRNLQIDSKYPVSRYRVIIPKRWSVQEIAYIQSTQKNVYYLYRINSKQWSNQLYTALTFNPKKTVIGPNLLYSLERIIQKFTISREVTISIGNQKDQRKRNSMMRKHYEKRDARTQFGIVDHENQSLKQFKQNTKNNNTFDFSDKEIFSSCILGWESDKYSNVTNRLKIHALNERQDKNFNILYNQSATIKKDDDYIISFFQQKEYLRIAQFQMIKHHQNNLINMISSTLICILFNNQLLKLNDKYEDATILKYNNSFYSQMSIHVLNKYNTRISVYPSGLIQISNRNNDYVSIYNIEDFLQQFSFIFQKEDYIYSIQQYQEIQFLIAFRNSFKYDVSFSSNTRKQLKIYEAFQYYYQDEFSFFISGFKGFQYTIFIGHDYLKTQYMFTLYSNQVQQSNVYLIQSTEAQIKRYLNFPQYMNELNSHRIDIQFSNSYQILSINIQDNIFVNVQNISKNNEYFLNSSLSLKGQNFFITYLMILSYPDFLSSVFIFLMSSFQSITNQRIYNNQIEKIKPPFNNQVIAN
ncbi:hypothetical protein ABPG72_001139 [Tetrahymena utriculariae]